MTPTRLSAGPALSSKTTAATSSTGSHSSSESSRIAAGLCERIEPDGEADLPSSHLLAAGCSRSSVRALYSPSGSSSSSPAALTLHLFADLGFLALQVILALGNRPKAEKRAYTISIAVFAFFSLYLIVCTVVLTVKAFCVRP